MFKIARYYLLMRFYRQIKSSLFSLAVSLILMVIALYFFGDLATMSEPDGRMKWIAAKWTATVMLLGISAYHMRKIAQKLTLPFTKEEVQAENTKKRVVLQKPTLQSRTDLVIAKYRKRI